MVSAKITMFNILHQSNSVYKYVSNVIVTRFGWIGGLITELVLGGHSFSPCVEQKLF